MTEPSEPEKQAVHTNEDVLPPEIENTGERFLPQALGTAEISYDHFARYRLAERYVEGKSIIDLGCGAGYGTYSLSALAREALGVDLSREAIDYAAWSYRAPNLRYETGDVTSLPYEAGSFEVAVSFEVIEHLERPEALAEEAKRLTGDSGVFVTSTPDKQTYSNDRNWINPHHLKEMYPPEFRGILERHFEHVRIYRQGVLAGSFIYPEGSELPEDGGVTLESTRFSVPTLAFGRRFPTTLYMVAVCSNGPEPETLDKPHMILDRDRQIYDEHAEAHATLGQILAYNRHNHRLMREEVKQLRQRMRELRERMQSSRGWRVARKLNELEARVRGLLRSK